jgi:hypothetical protein
LENIFFEDREGDERITLRRISGRAAVRMGVE